MLTHSTQHSSPHQLAPLVAFLGFLCLFVFGFVFWQRCCGRRDSEVNPAAAARSLRLLFITAQQSGSSGFKTRVRPVYWPLPLASPFSPITPQASDWEA